MARMFPWACAALQLVAGGVVAGEKPFSKRQALTVRAIGETGWRTASAPNGFPYAGKAGFGSRWERNWTLQGGGSTDEVIEVKPQ